MVIRMESKNGDVLKGIDHIWLRYRRAFNCIPSNGCRRCKRIRETSPISNKTVHQAFQQMVDQMVAGLLARGDPSDRVRSGRKKSDGESRREVT